MRRLSGRAILFSLLLAAFPARAQTPTIASFLPAAKIIVGIGAQADFTVTLSSPAQNDVTVNLFVVDLNVLLAPGSVTVPMGQSQALFQATSLMAGTSDIVASLNGADVAVSVTVLERAPAADFDGDGRSDILWRNATTGENYLYPMNGTTILGTEGYLRTVADQSWQVAGIGDFDGDGRADVLWRNSNSGENYVYLMNGTAISGEGYLRTVADQNWQVAGIGDFNGDGRSDVLWRNASSGENYLYPMNGMAILGSEGYLRTVADQDWKVAGVGDINGDGRSDILWRNATTGENYLYPMNGTAILGTEGYLRTVADANWKIVGTGDFNGDGKADVLWRNASTGENYLYPMNGTTILGTEGYLRTVADQNWKVQASGDYDGDGKADVLWRNSSTGENYLYPMDGTTITAGEGYLRTVADADWRVALGSAGTTKADVLFAFDTTGSMGGEIANLTAALSLSIIPQIRAALPDTAFGLVDFRDFGEPGGQWVVRYRHRIQTAVTPAGVASIQSAVNALAAAGGGDVPEAGWEAMYSIAGGPPITVAEYTSTFNLAATNPVAVTAGETQGTVGGAGFRFGALPIIVAITDAEWHDAPGSGGLNPYGPELAGVPSRAQAITRLNAIGARVISVVSLTGIGDVRTQGRLLAVATGATVTPAAWGAVRPAACAVNQCCTGVNGAGEAPIGPASTCPLVYTIQGTGAGLGNAVVDGVRTLIQAAQ